MAILCEEFEVILEGRIMQCNSCYGIDITSKEDALHLQNLYGTSVNLEVQDRFYHGILFRDSITSTCAKVFAKASVNYPEIFSDGHIGVCKYEIA
ncbi:hypothetical protein NVP1121O_239 [Vibrio phage 1.121.O._10N.286.46.C4]|nr:hypothetical protein NVP1121O_239 [Vibrio phage 1.121.O._10N.286.46.C4]